MKECKKMFNIKKYDYVPNIYDLIDFPPNESNENHTMDDLYFSSLRKSDKELYDFVKDFQIKYRYIVGPLLRDTYTLNKIKINNAFKKQRIF